MQVIFECFNRGLCVTQKQIEKYILLQADSKPRSKTFKNRRISQTWWGNFFNRHPEVAAKRGRNMENIRIENLSEKVINPFFQLLEDINTEYPTLWQTPFLFYNYDESSIKCAPKEDKVLGPSVFKQNRFLKEKKELATTHTTILAAVSGDSYKLPLDFIITEDTRFLEEEKWMFELMGPNTAFYRTETGYCTKKIFLYWFRDV